MGSVKLAEVGRKSKIPWDLHKGLPEIVQIIVSYNTDILKSIQFLYVDNGRVIASEIIGCQHFSGQKFNVITFKDRLEFITRVEGITYSCRGDHYIGKLSIHTNKTSYVIFEATILAAHPVCYTSSFSYNFGGEDQFGGFYGTHNLSEVTSIGFYFNHLTAPPSSKAKLQSKNASGNAAP